MEDTIENNKFYSGENLVFIIGVPRSGTTYLQKLLSSHPNVFTGQETHIFGSYFGSAIKSWQRHSLPNKTGRVGVGLPCYLKKNQFKDKLRKLIIESLFSVSGKLNDRQIFIEKTPRHALFIPEIQFLFPKSKFIILFRNPLDTCRSLLHAGKGWGKSWAPKRAITAAALWNNYMIEIDMQRNKVGSKCFNINYEELTKSTDTILIELFQFIGIKVTYKESKAIMLNNSKENSIIGKSGKIPIKGELANKVNQEWIEEPDGFINLEKYKLSIFEKLIIWNKTKNVCSSFGYRNSLLYFLKS